MTSPVDTEIRELIAELVRLVPQFVQQGEHERFDELSSRLALLVTEPALALDPETAAQEIGRRLGLIVGVAFRCGQRQSPTDLRGNVRGPGR